MTPHQQSHVTYAKRHIAYSNHWRATRLYKCQYDRSRPLSFGSLVTMGKSVKLEANIARRSPNKEALEDLPSIQRLVVTVLCTEVTRTK